MYFGGVSFTGGVIFIVSGLLLVFFELVFFYLLSEPTIVVVEIARNTKPVFNTYKHWV